MNNIPVFLASDNNYAPFVATTIASICDNTKSFVDFYILDGGITIENKEKIEKLKDKFNNFSIEFINIDVEKEFEGFTQSSVITKSTYSRFLIPQLKPKLNKAIYLDVDIILKEDILELWQQDLENKTLGWVDDTEVSPEFEAFYKELGIKCYFNAGVMLIDLKSWKEKDYTQKLLKLESEIRHKLKQQDQDLLNIIFENDCKKLNNKFNVQYGADDIIIRHYVNVFKPWKSNFFKIGTQIKPLENFDDFWKYAKITEFNTILEEQYYKNINANMLTKRMSIIADKMKRKLEMTKVTVIIPCHNGTNYLKDSYESVKKQGVDFEVIVVDDNSTDGTQAYAKELGIEKVYETTTAKGPSAARNVGLSHMTGDYVVFLDHDDIINENTFKLMLEEFEKDQELDAVMAQLVDFISPELTEEERKVLEPRKEPYGGLLTGAMMFKKEVTNTIGGFDEKLVTGQGVDFLLRFDKHNLKKLKLNFVATMRRFHNNNMGRTMQQQEFTDYASILRAKLAAARKVK